MPGFVAPVKGGAEHVSLSTRHGTPVFKEIPDIHDELAINGAPHSGAVSCATYSSSIYEKFDSYIRRRHTGRAEAKSIAEAEVIPLAGYNETFQQAAPVDLYGAVVRRQLTTSECAVDCRPSAFALLPREVVPPNQRHAFVQIEF
jgi:hypothetical protein